MQYISHLFLVPFFITFSSMCMEQKDIISEDFSVLNTVKKSPPIDFNNLDRSLDLQNIPKDVLFTDGKNFLACNSDIFDVQLKRLAFNIESKLYVSLLQQIKSYIDLNNILMTQNPNVTSLFQNMKKDAFEYNYPLISNEPQPLHIETVNFFKKAYLARKMVANIPLTNDEYQYWESNMHDFDLVHSTGRLFNEFYRELSLKERLTRSFFNFVIVNLCFPYTYLYGQLATFPFYAIAYYTIFELIKINIGKSFICNNSLIILHIAPLLLYGLQLNEMVINEFYKKTQYVDVSIIRRQLSVLR